MAHECKIVFLSAQDVCSIIESCAKTKIRTFKFHNLEMDFSPAPDIESPKLHEVVPAPDHERINADTLKQDTQVSREERLEMLLIEDPVEYERQIREGVLLDEPGSGIGDGEEEIEDEGA